MMKFFTVKLKYYIYGLIRGTLLSILFQAFYIETSLIDFKSILSYITIGIAVLAVFFVLRFFYIHCDQWRKLLYWRYFQQPSYCAIILAGFF